MIALDTNVLLYACDRADSRRQQIAILLIANSSDGTWAITRCWKWIGSGESLSFVVAQTLRKKGLRRLAPTCGRGDCRLSIQT